MRKRTFIGFPVCILLLLSSLNVNAQCLLKNTAFKDGEQVDYHIYYNLSFIWVHAGTATFSVRSGYYGTDPAYQLRVAGSTVKSFDKYYRVRDTLEAFVDTTHITPFYFKESNHEDSYWKKSLFEFSKTPTEWKATRSIHRKSGVTQDVVSSDRCFFDMVSTIYRIRNFDTKNLEPNQKIPFSLLLNDGIYPLYLRYVKKEEVKLKNGEKYRCLVFKPLLVEGDVFKNADGMTIWVTDDENKIPVYIESKIKVGSIKVQINTMKNLRHPLTSKVNKK